MELLCQEQHLQQELHGHQVQQLLDLGNNLPVFEAPIAICNDTLNRTLIFPRAKIVGSFDLTDGVLTAKISVTAQAIDTASLKTGMIVEGALN